MLLDPGLILEVANPVELPPWGCGLLLTPLVVYEVLDNNQLLSPPVSNKNDDDPLFHAFRIAWFIKHGWNDPIEICKTLLENILHGVVEEFSEWPIIDGNHRLYAAVIRGDTSISITCK